MLVRDEVLVADRVLRRRGLRVDGVVLLRAALLRGDGRHVHGPDLPARLHAEEPLVVLGVAGQLGAGERERGVARLDLLQDVVLELAGLRLAVVDLDVVADRELVGGRHLDGDVAPHAPLHAHRRLEVGREPGPEAGRGRAGDLLPAAADREDHAPLQLQLRLVELELLQPRRQLDRDVEVVGRLLVGRVGLLLPDQRAQPEPAQRQLVHLDRVVAEVAEVPRPERRLLARAEVAHLLRHLHLARLVVHLVVVGGRVRRDLQDPLPLVHALRGEHVVQRRDLAGEPEVGEVGRAGKPLHVDAREVRVLEVDVRRVLGERGKDRSGQKATERKQAPRISDSPLHLLRLSI